MGGDTYDLSHTWNTHTKNTHTHTHTHYVYMIK